MTSASGSGVNHPGEMRNPPPEVGADSVTATNFSLKVLRVAVVILFWINRNRKVIRID